MQCYNLILKQTNKTRKIFSFALLSVYGLTSRALRALPGSRTFGSFVRPNGQLPRATDSTNPMGSPYNVRCHFCICRTRKIESKKNNFDLLRTKVKGSARELRLQHISYAVIVVGSCGTTTTAYQTCSKEEEIKVVQ